MKRGVIILSLILGVLIIGTIVLIYYFSGNLGKEEIINKPTPEVLTFVNKYNDQINLSQPYVSCILNKTCNGTFSFQIEANLSQDLFKIKEFLNKYGNVTATSTLDHYLISFETDDLYKIGPLLNSSLFNDIILLFARSDYNLNTIDKDLHSCETDSDCVIVNERGCSPEPDIINKVYRSDAESYFKFSHYGESCASVSNPNIYMFSRAICQDKKCTYVQDKGRLCNSMYPDCKDQGTASENENILSGYNLSCKDIIDMCKENYIIENETTNLIVNIIFPNNNSVINASEVYINATTDKNAICSYTTSFRLGRTISGTGSNQMDVTNNEVHSQLIGDLQNSGYYTIIVECTNSSGSKGKASVNFLSRIYEFPPLRHTLLTKADLPILLNSVDFYDSNGLFAGDSQVMFFSYTRETSTSNGDLPYPEMLLEVGTDYNNYLYKYQLSFGKAVNFTKNDDEEWWIQLLGDNYKIMKGSTNQRIILNKDFSSDNFILENNQPLKINDQIIAGTYAQFDGNPIIRISISFAMQDPNKDYIAVGEYYDNPFFQNIRYSFASYSEQDGPQIYFGQV